MDLGDKIKELRKQKGMTQAELGLAVGVCNRTISGWEHKRYNKGIGHQFFEKVKQLKAEKGCDTIELQVNARNKKAYEMYRNYGFTEKSINMELK